MKSILRLIAVISTAAFTSYAQTTAAPEIDPATLDAIFSGLYPDLADHKDLIGPALASLTGEGFRSQSVSGMFAAVATRVRTNLQAVGQPRTDLDAEAFKAREDTSRAEAQRLYPQAMQRNSPLDLRIRSDRANLTRIFPNYFKNPDWPLMLTQGCVAAMAFEAQEKVAQQQARSAQPQMSAEQTRQALELIKTLQNGGSEQRPTQYNGRPLPRNWIDPKQADTNFFLQQLQNRLNQK